jgi:hypothetical protein
VSLADCAAQAVLQWDRDTAIIMVAIAGAESGWRNDAPSSVDVVGGPGDRPEWRQYACDGVYSWGLYQVHMPSHHARLQDVTGSASPCVWRDQLINPGFATVMAAEILAGQGLSAWSTYNVGAHLAYIAQATAAVDAALGVQPPGPYIQPPIWPPLPAGFLTLRLVDPSAAGRSVAPPARAVEPPPGYH